MAEAHSLVELVSRYLPLTANGSEAHGRCVFCSDERPDGLKVGDTAWRTVCCCQNEVDGSDAAGFLMSWSGCSREEALHQLSNGNLPEPMPVQHQPLRRACFWGVKALLDAPSAIVWVHWVSDGVHFGREHFQDRVHLGLCQGRELDDASISLLDRRNCILLPDNRESSLERADELAAMLYAAGHKKVRYVRVQDQEECWSWPGEMIAKQALAFAQKNVCTYPQIAPSPGLSLAVSASSPDGGAPEAAPAASTQPIEAGSPSNGNPASPVAATLNASLNASPALASHVGSGTLPPADTAGAGGAPIPHKVAQDVPEQRPRPERSSGKPPLSVVDGGALRAPHIEPDPDQLPAFSEFALAKAFADGPGTDWRYTAAWGLWAKWDGAQWVHDERKGITWEAKNCCSAIMKEHLTDSTPAQRSKVGTLKTVTAVIGLAGADPRIATGAEQWDADPYLLGTPAGIVDLRTGAIAPALKDQLISKSTCIAPVAGAHPWWDRVLERPQGGAMVEFLQLWCGYVLTGDTREERFLFVHGPGGGGKSKFLAVLSEILGDYRRTAPMDAFTVRQHHEHSEEIARLAGARLVVATETDDSSRWNEARIKQLTGRDLITARHMRMSSFEFPPQFKLVFIGNHKPALRSVGEEMRRRIDLVDWGGTIPDAERVLDLPDKLRAEYPAILAWMIEGCLKWQRQGLGKPPEVAASVADYIQGEDTLGAWMDECVELHPMARVKSGDAYHNFRRWAEGAGEFVPSQRRFTQRLRERGIGTLKSGDRYFTGMRLKLSDAEVRETAGWVPDN